MVRGRDFVRSWLRRELQFIHSFSQIDPVGIGGKGVCVDFCGVKSCNMKRTSANRLTKLILFAFTVCIGAFTLVSFRIKEMEDDLWQKLGISKLKGEENIKQSFLNGYFHYYGARNAKNILRNDRAAVAMDLMKHAKQQLSSEAFKKEYEKIRASAKPVPSPYKAKTKEEIRKEKIAELEKSIKDAEDLVKKMPELEKNMRPTIDMFRQNLKDYQDPNSEMIELFYQTELNTKAQRELNFEENMKRWEKEYPENCNTLIRERLEHFVKVARTVDFSAELKEVNGRKKFVNPAYEAKSTEWKQIFRAGKEVIDPAISFAEQWIKELK